MPTPHGHAVAPPPAPELVLPEPEEIRKRRERATQMVPKVWKERAPKRQPPPRPEAVSQALTAQVQRVAKWGMGTVRPPLKERSRERPETVPSREERIQALRAEHAAILERAEAELSSADARSLMREFQAAVEQTLQGLDAQVTDTQPAQDTDAPRAPKSLTEEFPPSTEEDRARYANCREFQDFPASKKAVGAKNTVELITLVCERNGWRLPYLHEIRCHKKLYRTLTSWEHENGEFLKRWKSRNKNKIEDFGIDFSEIAQRVSSRASNDPEVQRLVLAAAYRITREIGRQSHLSDLNSSV